MQFSKEMAEDSTPSRLPRTKRPERPERPERERRPEREGRPERERRPERAERAERERRPWEHAEVLEPTICARCTWKWSSDSTRRTKSSRWRTDSDLCSSINYQLVLNLYYRNKHSNYRCIFKYKPQ
jgi:hypothetical protein